MAEPARRELELLEIDLLLEAVSRHAGFDFRDYARTSITRRVRKMLARDGLPSVSALQERLLREPEALTAFVEMVGVHTTSMFRDPDFFRALRSEVVPLLRTYPFVRIWHAGCASGEEAYSVAIVLHEEGIYDRCRIYATDVSDTILDKAKRGIFPLHAMRDYTHAYQSAGGSDDFSSYYVADQKSAILRQSLRRNIIFAQHNLASDSVFNEFHLVLCRNVGIYFNEPLRQRMHDLIYRSLVPFGILGVGKKESMRYTAYNDLYEELPSGVRLYRKRR